MVWNLHIGMNGERGSAKNSLTRFLPSETLLLFDEKYIFPRQFCPANQSSQSEIEKYIFPRQFCPANQSSQSEIGSTMLNTRAGVPAQTPTGKAFMVRPLSNRLSSSLNRFSWAIF